MLIVILLESERAKMLNMSESLNFLKKDFFMGSNYWFVILEHLGNKFQRKINKMARLFLAEP